MPAAGAARTPSVICSKRYGGTRKGRTRATRMADVLIKANKAATAARTAGKPCLDDADLEQIRVLYRSAALQGLLDNESRRGAAAKRARTLARRFRDHEDVILRFATDLGVGFTNNQAERGRAARQGPDARLRRSLANPPGAHRVRHRAVLPVDRRQVGHRQTRRA